MNRQTADKVSFFMTGLEGRFSEEDESCGVEGYFTSGLKKYAFKAERTEGKLSFNFGGSSYLLDYAGFCDFIIRKIPDYDALEVIIHGLSRDTVLMADGKNVITKTQAVTPKNDSDENRGASMSNRKYYIKPELAADMLRAIGVLGQNGKVLNDKIRKYNQIDHFVELIDPMLRKIVEEKKNAKDRTINIVDCACGKSYLSFALNYYVTEVLGAKCYFTGLDYNKTVIEDSERIANTLKYTNMKFVETDIMKYSPDRKYDLLITLHACDTATDKSLRFGLDNGVRCIVCVPCCHKEMNVQGYTIPSVQPVLKYGILKARIADSLTDGLRALYLEAMGYDVSMVEYISPLDTPKNLMLRCYKTRGYDAVKMYEFESTCESLGVKLSISGEA